MNYGKLSHDYSKCSPAIRATADVASAIHRLADVFYVVAQSMALGARTQAAATEVFGRHLELLSATLTTAVASNAEHSRELGRHLDEVAKARSEVEATNAELVKARDSLRYAHRRIEQLQADSSADTETPAADAAPKRRKGKRKTGGEPAAQAEQDDVVRAFRAEYDPRHDEFVRDLRAHSGTDAAAPAAPEPEDVENG